MLYFSHFSLKCLVSVICCIQPAFIVFVSFFFNYPIVSRCTKFVFQKRCELDVIYILFLPWPKEGFASRKQSRKKNFAQREQYRSLLDIKISGQQAFLRIDNERKVSSFKQSSMKLFQLSLNMKIKRKCGQKSNIFKIWWQQPRNRFGSYSQVRQALL